MKGVLVCIDIGDYENQLQNIAPRILFQGIHFCYYSLGRSSDI
jgi:hypothetical protein